MPKPSEPDEAADADPARLVAQPRDGDNAPALTVSELSGAIRGVVEDRFGRVRVRGEVSGFKRAASGHVYLALKDDGALIDGVMWKGSVGRLAFRPEDGMEVIAAGRVTTYPGRSKYQIVIDRMELAGEGALMALYERLKARLGAEGLFDADRKQPLPSLPRVIGVVTSPTGAVIRDILHRLADRFPTRVIVWPVRVQGDGAAAEVAAAIAGFDAIAPGSPDIPRPDLLIVARGGGSIEDLWAFNEEAVVRALAACRIPVISAVGHETDTSLADFAADRRAPTPTAAAEMAVPVRADLIARVDDLVRRNRRAAARHLALGRERLKALVRMLPRRERLYEPQAQRVDDLADRMQRAMVRHVAARRERLTVRASALRPELLARQTASARDRLTALWRVAQSLDPRLLLDRGWAMVQSPDGVVVTRAAQAQTHSDLRIVFADGGVDVVVAGGPVEQRPDVSPPSTPPRKPQATRKPTSENTKPTSQGSLF